MYLLLPIMLVTTMRVDNAIYALRDLSVDTYGDGEL